MIRQRAIVRVISVVVCFVFLWTNCIWAGGLSIYSADKLAAQSQIQDVILGAHLMYTADAALERVLINDIGGNRDIYRNIARIRDDFMKVEGISYEDKENVMWLVFGDEENPVKKAYYIFTTDGIYFRYTTSPDVQDPFLEVVKGYGKLTKESEQVQINGDKYYREAYRIIEQNKDFINTVLKSLYGEVLQIRRAVGVEEGYEEIRYQDRIMGAVIKSGFITEDVVSFSGPTIGGTIKRKAKGDKEVDLAKSGSSRFIYVREGKVRVVYIDEKCEGVNVVELDKGDGALVGTPYKIEYLEGSIILEVNESRRVESKGIVVRKDFDLAGKRFKGFTPDAEPLQVAIFTGAKGTKGDLHYHTPREGETIPRQEMCIILEGKARVGIYSKDWELVRTVELKKGDSILLTEAHHFEFLEDTKFLEIKQGPYPGSKEADKIIEDIEGNKKIRDMLDAMRDGRYGDVIGICEGMKLEGLVKQLYKKAKKALDNLNKELDVIDEEGNIIVQKARTKVHRDGDLHRNAHVIIFDSSGRRILMQKRASNKDIFPGKWAISACGHVDSGGTIIGTAINETKQEVGLELSEGRFVLIGSEDGYKGFLRVYEFAAINHEEIEMLKEMMNEIDDMQGVYYEHNEKLNILTIYTFLEEKDNELKAWVDKQKIRPFSMTYNRERNTLYIVRLTKEEEKAIELVEQIYEHISNGRIDEARGLFGQLPDVIDPTYKDSLEKKIKGKEDKSVFGEVDSLRFEDWAGFRQKFNENPEDYTDAVYPYMDEGVYKTISSSVEASLIIERARSSGWFVTKKGKWPGLTTLLSRQFPKDSGVSIFVREDANGKLRAERLTESKVETYYYDESTGQERLIGRSERENLTCQPLELDVYGDKAIVIPYGNLYLNSHFVTFSNGVIYHQRGEPLDKRTYTSFVVWKDERKTIERLKYVKGKDGERDKVFIVGKPEDIADKISCTFFGQQIVKDGDLVNVADILGEFDDLNQVISEFPVIDGKETYDFKTLHSNPEKAGELIRKGLTKAGIYPHSILGLTQDGDIIVVAIAGVRKDGAGVSIEEAAKIAKERGAVSAIILANGGDVNIYDNGEIIAESNRDRKVSSYVIINPYSREDKQKGAGIVQQGIVGLDKRATPDGAISHLFPKDIHDAIEMELREERRWSPDRINTILTKGAVYLDPQSGKMIIDHAALEVIAQVINRVKHKNINADDVLDVLTMHEKIEQVIHREEIEGKFKPILEKLLLRLREYYKKQNKDADAEIRGLLDGFCRNYAYKNLPDLEILRELIVHGFVERYFFKQPVRIRDSAGHRADIPKGVEILLVGSLSGLFGKWLGLSVDKIIDIYVDIMGLNEMDRVFIKGLYEKYQNPDTVSLIIGDNFFPSAMLSEEERSQSLGAFDFKGIGTDADYEEDTKGVELVLNPLDGGVGKAVERKRFLSIRKGRTITDDDLGSKSADMPLKIKKIKGYDAQGNEVEKAIEISIMEAKIIKAARDVHSYGRTVYQLLGSTATEKSVNELLGMKCLEDRLDDRIPWGQKRTYKEYLEAKGVQIANVVSNSELPTLDITGTQKSNEREKAFFTSEHIAPGSHGHIGVMLLLGATEEELPEDRVVIHAFYNGDGINNGVSPAMVGWMKRNKVPIVMLTTEKTPIDKKGGQIGVQYLGPGRTNPRPQIMELKQAVASGQEQRFYRVGLPGGEGEAGQQYFNTNTVLLNYSILGPFLRELRGILGETEFIKIISPDLIESEKKKERKRFRLFEGAISSVVLNLASFIKTTTDQRVEKLLQSHGINRDDFVKIVNLKKPERTKFFTPFKFSSDYWFQFYSGRFEWDAKKWELRDKEPDSPLPSFDIPDKDGQYYADVQKLIEAFDGVTVSGLRSLRISGKVELPGVILKGDVVIENNSGGEIDITDPRFKNLLISRGARITDNNKIILEDVIISIYCNSCGDLDTEVVGEKKFDEKTYILNRCRRCGSIWLSPRPTLEEIKEEVYTERYFTRKNYLDREAERRGRARGYLRGIEAKCGGKGKILDVGAAVGYLVKEAHDSGWSAEGVELSEWAVRKAEEMYGIHLIHGTIGDVKMGGYDVISMNDLLEHVLDPIGDLKKANALLKNDGLVAITTPILDSLCAVMQGNDFWEISENHNFLFTLDALEKMLYQSGFEVVGIETAAGIDILPQIEGWMDNPMGEWFGKVTIIGKKVSSDPRALPMDFPYSPLVKKYKRELLRHYIKALVYVKKDETIQKRLLDAITRAVEGEMRSIMKTGKTDITEEIIQYTLGMIRERKLRLKGEEVDVIYINENGEDEIVGVIDRNIVHEIGLLHRTSNVFLVTPDGKIVLQRRMPFRKLYPLKLSIFGGHLRSGEGYEETVKRKIVYESGFPQNWILQGELRRVGVEGEYFHLEHRDKNKERRSLYVYFLTEEECGMLKEGMQEIESVKRDARIYEDAIAGLELAGLHERVWGIYEVDLSDIRGQSSLEIEDGFGLGGEVLFTEDLLKGLANDVAVMNTIEREISLRPVGGKYSTQDTSIARRVSLGEQVNLWEVRVDAGRLTDDVGLSPENPKYVKINREMLQRVLDRIRDEEGDGILAVVDAIRVVDNLKEDEADGLAPFSVIKKEKGKKVLILDVDAFEDENLLYLVLKDELIESIMTVIPYENEAVRELTANYMILKFAFENGIVIDKTRLMELNADLQFLEALELLKKLHDAGEEITDDRIIAVAIEIMRGMPYYTRLFQEFPFASEWRNTMEGIQGAEVRYESALTIFNDIMDARLGKDGDEKQELQKGLKKVVEEVNVNIRVLKAFTGEKRVLGLEGLSRFSQRIIGAMAKVIWGRESLRKRLDEYVTRPGVNLAKQYWIIMSKERREQLEKMVGKDVMEEQIRALEDMEVDGRKLFRVVGSVNEVTDTDAFSIESPRVIYSYDLEDWNKLDKRGDILYLPIMYTSGSLYLAAQLVVAGGNVNAIGDKLTLEIFKSLCGAILGREPTMDDYNMVFRMPWKVVRITENINILHIAIVKIEMAA